MPKYLRELRKKHNIMQQEVADALGVSRQIVNVWERGSYVGKPTIKNLRGLKRFFEGRIPGIKISEDDLMREVRENDILGAPEMGTRAPLSDHSKISLDLTIQLMNMEKAELESIDKLLHQILETKAKAKSEMSP